MWPALQLNRQIRAELVAMPYPGCARQCDKTQSCGGIGLPLIARILASCMRISSTCEALRCRHHRCRIVIQKRLKRAASNSEFALESEQWATGTEFATRSNTRQGECREGAQNQWN
jgi:hypothetical protein